MMSAVTRSRKRCCRPQSIAACRRRIQLLRWRRRCLQRWMRGSKESKTLDPSVRWDDGLFDACYIKLCRPSARWDPVSCIKSQITPPATKTPSVFYENPARVRPSIHAATAAQSLSVSSRYPGLSLWPRKSGSNLRSASPTLQARPHCGKASR